MRRPATRAKIRVCHNVRTCTPAKLLKRVGQANFSNVVQQRLKSNLGTHSIRLVDSSRVIVPNVVAKKTTKHLQPFHNVYHTTGSDITWTDAEMEASEQRDASYFNQPIDYHTLKTPINEWNIGKPFIAPDGR